MPAFPDQLVQYVVALCDRAQMSHREIARLCGVSDAAMCRWLASDPAQHRDPAPRNAAVLRAVIARLEAAR